MNVTREMIKQAYENDHAATTILLAKQWLVDHPDDLAVTIWYGEMLYGMTRYDEAVQLLTDAIDRFELPSARYFLFHTLGHLQRYRGNYVEAESWYQKAVEMKPDFADGYIFLGAILARQGKLKDAVQTHTTASECSKGSIDEAFHNIGLVLRGQGKLKEAAEYFRRAIEIDPGYSNALAALKDVELAVELNELLY